MTNAAKDAQFGKEEDLESLLTFLTQDLLQQIYGMWVVFTLHEPQQELCGLRVPWFFCWKFQPSHHSKQA